MPDARTHEANIDPNNSQGALASGHFLCVGSSRVKLYAHLGGCAKQY